MTWWTWLIILWVIVLPISGEAIYWQVRDNKRHNGFNIAGHVIGWVLIFLAFIATLAPCIQAIGNHQTAVSCRNWAIANNRPTKYVVYNFWSTDCVTPSGNGHWISTGQIVANNVTVNK